MQTHTFQNWFHQVVPYINLHHHKYFIICLPFEVITESYLTTLVADIALLQSLSVRCLLVFDCHPKTKPLQTILRQAVDQETLTKHLKTSGETLAKLTAAFSLGLPQSPLHGAAIEVLSGNWITARPYGVHEGTDHLFSGQVRRVDTENLQTHLKSGRLLLVPPLGYSPTGECFTLPAQELAVDIAMALRADKLIFLTDFEQLTDKQGPTLREVLLPQMKNIQVTEEQTHFLNLSKQAANNGVNRVHLVSYKSTGSLCQELFTREGSGSMITRNRVETIRTARPTDISTILAIIKPLEQKGTLVGRNRTLLERDLNYFTVLERDGCVIGCAALYHDPISKSAEIACLAIHPEYQKLGKGGSLLHNLQQKALHLKIEKLFLLTTHTSHWFLEQGFTAGCIEDLPSDKRTLYNAHRNSHILIKSLKRSQ